MTDEYFHKTTNVNFSGVFYCAREAGKVFKKQGSGSFIITASMSGHIVNVPKTQAVYNAHSSSNTLPARLHLTDLCALQRLVSSTSASLLPSNGRTLHASTSFRLVLSIPTVG